MKITFGMHLDGQRAWLPRNSINEIYAGPLGLLGALEMQLGLAGSEAWAAPRIVKYANCIKSTGTEGRFFEKAFRIDEYAAAEKLLSWRDELYLHGWNGQAPADGSRVADLAQVEVAAKEYVDPCIGQRLRAITEALKVCRPAIDKVLLVDPLQTLPLRWREMLSLLNVEPLFVVRPNAQNDQSFLRQVQEALLTVRQGKIPARVSWRSDGSVSVYQSETRVVANTWLAHELAATPADTLLIVEANGYDLDAASGAAHLARMAISDKSHARPALQVLPLALALLWDPLDFANLIKFLDHPIVPIPRAVRARLASHLAQTPGIGGGTWIRAVDEALAQQGEKAEEIKSSIKFWLEHQRFKVPSGAPLGAVLDRVNKVAEYLRARASVSDDIDQELFAAGYGQAVAMQQALGVMAGAGEKIVQRQQLRILLRNATRGTASPYVKSEVGSSLVVSDPAAAIEARTRVKWYQPRMPALPKAYPWFASEVAELKTVGVELAAVGDQLKAQADQWYRPVLAAQQELVIVLPPPQEEAHPLWLMFQSAFDGIEIKSLEELLTNEKLANLEKVKYAALPARKRWWNLGEKAISRRETESYSSLDLFINDPYEWVLKYGAKLRASTVVSLPDDRTLFGNLAHRAIERFYRSKQALLKHPDEASNWIDANLPRIIQEEGAVLLMPGRAADYVRFIGTMKTALGALQAQLRNTKVVAVEPERSVRGTFQGGKVEGFVDLVVKKSNGEEAIVDLKWSGLARYRDKLIANSALQLAIYSELVRQETGKRTAVAYFIVREARLLAPNTEYFPAAQSATNPRGANVEELWSQFNRTWSWRDAQIERGDVEVVLEGIEPDERSVPPEGSLMVDARGELYNDYLLLAGWPNERQ